MKYITRVIVPLIVSMKWYVYLFTAILLCSCNDETNQPASGVISPSSCKGVYSLRDNHGNLQKYNEYWLASANACLTDKIALTNYEASTEVRRKQKVTCLPQATIPTMALKASGNFYSYRNDRYYLDLDSSKGQFRRILMGEDHDGKVVYQRDISCFYARTDHEIEPVNPRDYGSQLLLDFSNHPASSADFVPNEIFKYTSDGSGNWYFTRYDDVGDWGFSFCPELTVPFANCTSLRNGNLYFYPLLDAPTRAALVIEAKLIRTQFNFSAMTRADFQTLWDSLDQSGKELQQGGDWLYYTNHVVDASKLFDYSWRRYVMGLDQTMPDIGGVLRLPPICYSGSQTVTLSNGNTAKVFGQICYSNGVYTFTQQ
jgi:hypothetical protein